MPTVQTLRAAWELALYGRGGRFTRPAAQRDFATALTDPVTGPVLASALADVARRADDALGRPADFTVVDVGAGTGAYLAHLAAAAPRRWRLVGVERCPRPVGLDQRIAWRAGIPAGFRGFLLAHEWLDDVPIDIVREGRTVLVDGSLGGPHDPSWLVRWGGTEDGTARDLQWRAATDRLEAGVALAIDYGHTTATRRPTLTGWRDGRPVPPALDGSCDVTAHVALDALAAVVPGSVRTTQRDALALLEAGDPTTAAGLARASAVRALRAPDGYGGYGWVTVRKGLPSGP